MLLVLRSAVNKPRLFYMIIQPEVKNSYPLMMLFLLQDSGLHQDQSPPPPSVSSGPTADPIGDGWKRGSRREIHRAEREKDIQRERVPEGEEESCAVNSYHLSEATTNYFQCSNGGLTPKANTNGIIIHSQRSVM